MSIQLLEILKTRTVSPLCNTYVFTSIDVEHVRQIMPRPTTSLRPSLRSMRAMDDGTYHFPTSIGDILLARKINTLRYDAHFEEIRRALNIDPIVTMFALRGFKENPLPTAARVAYQLQQKQFPYMVASDMGRNYELYVAENPLDKKQWIGTQKKTPEIQRQEFVWA